MAVERRWIRQLGTIEDCGQTMVQQAKFIPVEEWWNVGIRFFEWQWSFIAQTCSTVAPGRLSQTIGSR
eukprot:3148428-Pyramimonas_sp.AAC.1